MSTRRKRLTIAVAAAALIVGVACSSGSNDDGDSGSDRTVRYEITGAGQATNVTYSSGAIGSQSQETSVTLPWEKEVKVPEDKSNVPTVVAQRGAGTGDITCRITVDGKEAAKATSSGEYAVVTCASELEL